MTSLDIKIKQAYFSMELKKSLEASNFAEGYKEGFAEALNEIKSILNGKPNNKERLISIQEFLNDFFKEERHDNT